MRKNRRWLIVGGLVVALVIAGAMTRGFGLLNDRGSGLRLYGNVDVRQVDLAFRVSGRIAAIGPEEGQRVEAGQVVAELDKGPFKDRLSAAQAQLQVAEAELAKTRAGNRPQEIARAEAGLTEAEAALSRSKQDYERRSALVKDGAISRQAFDATASQYEIAQAQVKSAQEALSLAREGARAEDRESAVARVEAARADVASAKTNLADTSLTAPNAGTVLTRAHEPGAIVQAGETVLTLTIDRPVRIRAYVGARDLSRIEPGMEVTVEADGNPTVYKGVISQISPTAEFTPKTVQTEDLRTDLVYRVRVLINDPDDALRQGQPVTVNVPGARPPEGR